MNEAKTEELKLPEEISKVRVSPPRDLVILGIPKIGKGTILGKLTEERNAIVLDLERGGYDYIPARKLSAYTSYETTRFESYQNYLRYRNLLLANKGKYEFLIIDGLSDLDALSDIGGTFAYMNSVIGKNFNRTKTGEKMNPTDPEWKSVLNLPDGAGYKYLRDWFLQQVEFFSQMSPYRIYAAHVVDKYIKDNGKEEVVGSEINLTGKLKIIFSSRVTSLCKLIAEDNERYLSFDVVNNSIVAGSRAPHLKGKILISRQEKDDSVTTFWDAIYPRV